MKDLTPYERSLANRFRLDLFDVEVDDPISLIDSEHPEFPAVMWMALPPKRKKRAKRESQTRQEQMEL